MNRAIFAINSSIGEAGQGLAVNQALIEFKRQGLIEKIYCSAKGRHILADLPIEIVSLPSKLTSLLVRLPYLRSRKDIITLTTDIIFDKLIFKKINLQDEGFFIAVSGHCSDTIKKLKTHFRKKTISYCHGAHIKKSYDILQEEDRIFSKGLRTHFIHKGMIKRVLQEYECCDYIFVVSKYAYDTFIENGVKEDRLRIVRSGIDLSRFYPNVAKKDNTFRVCFSGMVTLRKGFHYLLQAIDELNLPDVEVLIYGGSGDSICHGILKYYKKKIKIQQYSGDPAKVYWQSDIFVLPSLEDAWSLAVSEAIACGLPVIVSEHTGAKDIVKDGVNGFIIPIRDVKAIKEKIILLYSDRNLRKRMSEAALEMRQVVDQSVTSKIFFEECMNLA